MIETLLYYMDMDVETRQTNKQKLDMVNLFGQLKIIIIYWLA